MAVQRLFGMLMLLTIAVAPLCLRAQDNAKVPDEILGEWWTENNEGRIRITRDKEGFYRGTTTCCVHKDENGHANLDKNNPNPALRTRSTLGIVLIWKLKYEAGEYVDGYVYNPRDGKSYRMQMKLVDHETVKIRGYMGIPLLGQTQIWKRFHGSRS